GQGSEVRAGVARAALAGGVRGSSPAGDRAALVGQVRQHEGRRHLQVRRVRPRAVRQRHEVRERVRVAQLHRPQGPRERRAHRGPLPRDGPHRGHLCALRLAPRARVPRRPRADRRALLHEQRRAEAGRGRL
ncbi:MAG: Peptide-methionine (R)-S-oxide reductase MsrB, partial [uncultured Solirubrobacteraceae bacterium]